MITSRPSVDDAGPFAVFASRRSNFKTCRGKDGVRDGRWQNLRPAACMRRDEMTRPNAAPQHVV